MTREVRLIEAIKKGDLKRVKELVLKGVDPRSNNNFPVQVAAEKGQLEIVKYLVSQGADVRSEKDWSFRWAANNGHLDVVKYLVAQGADIEAKNGQALRWAAGNGHFNIVKYLISKGANAGDASGFRSGEYAPWEWAEVRKHKEIAGFLKLCLKTDKLSKMLVEGMVKDV